MQDELRQQYLDSLPDRLENIKTLIKEVRTGNQEAEEKIRLIAHSLYGSGATFGFPKISESSGKVEQAKREDLLKHLAELMTVLKDTLKQGDAVPAKEAEEQADETIEGKVEGKVEKSTSILLIEDDPECAAIVIHTIHQTHPDLKIEQAASAKLAQEFLVKYSYALIILDLVLPDRDGREILREIRQDFNLATPVLVLTGVNKDIIRVECMSFGADKVMTKPFDAETLIPIVDVLLKKNDKAKLALVPIGNEAAEQKAPSTSVKMDLNGKNVLLAEDDKVQAAMIKQKLMAEGLAVHHVENGRDAMQALRSKTYSLIILDVKMPMMTGFEVLERVRNELELTEVPVIMVTAMGGESDIIKGYDLGADDYLLKPFSPVQLVARVKSLLK